MEGTRVVGMGVRTRSGQRRLEGLPALFDHCSVAVASPHLQHTSPTHPGKGRVLVQQRGMLIALGSGRGWGVG